MDSKNRAVITYFDQQLAACKAKKEKLEKENRVEELNLTKIRENVFDIFRTVFQTALRTKGEGEPVRHFFEERVRTIPEAWQASFQKASEAGDEKTKSIETVKLETLREIEREFAHIWEEQP
jgi:truncated hemoglobin YjbI